MKKIFLTSVIFFSCQFVNAAEKVTPEQNYMNRESIRQDYARRVAAANEKNLSAIRNSSSGTGVNKTVISQINSTASASDGSAVKGGATITKPVDAAKVGKTMAERLSKAKALGKASLPSFLGSAALTALVQGVGWIIDKGGEVKKIPMPTDATNPIYQYYYTGRASINDFDAVLVDVTQSTPDSICKMLDGKRSSNVGTLTYKRTQDLGNNTYSCVYHPSQYAPTYESPYATVTRKANPAYNPSTPMPTPVAVTDTDLENTITNYITNNDNSVTNNIINNSYSYDSSNGATASDPSNALVVDTHKDMGTALTNAASAPYSAGTPTKGSYSITDGKKTVEGHVDTGTTTGTTTGNTTTTNPDGSTSTGETESEFSLPAFCDWASIVCEWIDWTKEEPKEIESEEVEIEEQDDMELDESIFDASGECPPDLVISYTLMSQHQLSFSYANMCNAFSIARPVVIFIGFLISIFILGGYRSGGDE